MPRTAIHSPAPNSRTSLLGWSASRGMPRSSMAQAASRSCSRATTTSCRPTAISIHQILCQRRSPSAGKPRPFSAHSRPSLVYAIRALHPEAPMYTFWDYMRNRWPRDAGLRIDHLLLSAQAAKRLVSAGVDRQIRGRQGASDHAPAWVVLRDDAKARRNSARPMAKTARGSARRNARPPPRRPLLVIDGDSFAHRAYHALPKTILRRGGRPAGAILGFANLLLRLYREEQPRA